MSHFDPKAYGETVAAILALDGNGERLIPLTRGKCSSERAYTLLKGSDASALFAGSRAPEASLAGLYVYFSCWDEAHQTAQDISTREGAYWHAIVHRQEPDAGNSAYWFGQVGDHPIFTALASAAGVARWDPRAFIRQCEQGSQGALELQRTEWQLLFDYCAAKKS